MSLLLISLGQPGVMSPESPYESYWVAVSQRTCRRNLLRNAERLLFLVGKLHQISAKPRTALRRIGLLKIPRVKAEDHSSTALV